MSRITILRCQRLRAMGVGSRAAAMARGSRFCVVGVRAVGSEGSLKREFGASSPFWEGSGRVASFSLRMVARVVGSRIGAVFGLKGLRVRREMVRRWEWRW